MFLAACAVQDGAAAKLEHVTVFAAASLTDAFDTMGTAFSKAHPDVTIEFNYLASSDLAAQIEQGAPADVFASADQISMQRVLDAELATEKPQVFAHNTLAIVVPEGNPGAIDALQDLAGEDLVISICNDECPAGRYALDIFARAGVEVMPDSYEVDVKGVVTRVAVGEADAGIAYITDVIAAGGSAEGVVIPERDNVVAAYSIVAIDGSSPTASEFISFVLSPEGQGILRQHGFLHK